MERCDTGARTREENVERTVRGPQEGDGRKPRGAESSTQTVTVSQGIVGGVL